MIKKKIKVQYKDDKIEEFEAVDNFVNGPFYRIFLTHERTVEIPIEAIKRIVTKEVWIKPKK